nr:uncharacterized protein LOC119181207 [Rhipicephalus microplus]
MLQIKDQVVDAPNTPLCAILELNLKSAFDTVRHTAILEKISQLNLGKRFHRYLGSFLDGREARIKIHGLPTNMVEIKSAGRPQDSVLSPMLFNLVMIGLPEQLNAIKGINHTIYVYDITIWTTESMSSGSMQEKLKRAVSEVEKHLEGTGLVCLSNKSGILLHRPRKPGRPLRVGAEVLQTGVCVMTKEGVRIPTVFNYESSDSGWKKTMPIPNSSAGCRRKWQPR